MNRTFPDGAILYWLTVGNYVLFHIKNKQWRTQTDLWNTNPDILPIGQTTLNNRYIVSQFWYNNSGIQKSLPMMPMLKGFGDIGGVQVRVSCRVWVGGRF